MAWLELEPSGQYHVAFRYGGRKFKRSLQTSSERDAEQLLRRVERKLQLLTSGDIDPPHGVDLPTFLLTDGRRTNRPSAPQVRTLKDLFDAYRSHLPETSVEANTRYTAGLHLKHLQRVLGSRLDPQSLDLTHLQRYVDTRKSEPGRRGRTLSPTTIRKELATLSGVWKWAQQRRFVSRPLPSNGLSYPKEADKPPFQTWTEIERQISRGGLDDAEIEELWACLYLRSSEVTSVVAFVEEHARHPFLPPMVAAAAYTGARRSELIRAEIGDVDFDAGLVRIREKKRRRGRLTLRTVPLSPPLKRILRRWIDRHPGGRSLFCLCESIAHSRKLRPQPQPLTVDEATDHFKRTLQGSPWEPIRGWHVFRHSFASNCAAKGVDQRLIDEWMGHQTPEMVKRYRHLFPDVQAAALASVFG